MIVILPGPWRWPGHSQVCQMYDHSYRTTRPARSREWSRPRETGPPLVRSVLAGHYGCSPARTGGSVAGQGARRGTAPRALDRGSPLPLWAQLRADLQRRLSAGAFTNAFPGELALVSEYGVSRHTVRDRPAGVAGRRHRGSRARPPSPAGRACHDHPAAGRAVLALRLGRVRGPAPGQHRAGPRPVRRRVIADRLGLGGSTPLFHLERLPLGGGEPLALDTVWLPAEIAAPLLEANFTHTALYDELAARTGIRLEGGREHIRAVVPTRAQQRLL